MFHSFHKQVQPTNIMQFQLHALIVLLRISKKHHLGPS